MLYWLKCFNRLCCKATQSLATRDTCKNDQTFSSLNLDGTDLYRQYFWDFNFYADCTNIRIDLDYLNPTVWTPTQCTRGMSTCNSWIPLTPRWRSCVAIKRNSLQFQLTLESPHWIILTQLIFYVLYFNIDGR